MLVVRDCSCTASSEVRRPALPGNFRLCLRNTSNKNQFTRFARLQQMKRSTPVDGFADGDISSKRQRVPIVIHHRFAYPQPGAKFASERPQDGAVYDDLLRRAISVALYSSGFDCVQQSAIEGFLALVESC